MGTRGTFGVHVDGELKAGYNQYDSYPGGWGVDNLRSLRKAIEDGREDELRTMAREALLVDNTTPPTDEDVEALSKQTDLGVSNQSTDDWYCLTRETHGDILKMIECGYILDHSDFGYDSLFCEWGYVIDFDRRQFEAYKGHQKRAADKGRWKDEPVSDNGYGPIQLVALYSFDDLPTDENFTKDMEGEASLAWYGSPA